MRPACEGVYHDFSGSLCTIQRCENLLLEMAVPKPTGSEMITSLAYVGEEDHTAGQTPSLGV